MKRLNECMNKVSQVRKELLVAGVAGVIIREQANFTYLTGGGRGFLGLASVNACGALLITKNKIYLIANNIEIRRLMEEELPRGFAEAVEVLWPEDHRLMNETKRLSGGKVVSDLDVGEYFFEKRINLCDDEIKRYRILSADAANALEEALKFLPKKSSEFEAAGRISSSLWARGIEPISLFIAADDRIGQYRHFVPTSKRVEKQLVASICARRSGLVASVTRSISFGKPAVASREGYDKLLQVEADIFSALCPGAVLGGIFDRICDSYKKNGLPGEWKNHHQGGLTGYAAREIRVDRNTQCRVGVNQAYAFNPSCSRAKLEDTVLVTDLGVEIMSQCGSWPTMTVAGRKRPDILVRGY